jgi:two-component system, OmpR family, phosphate regulon sensor histidine kinase PhoR
VSLLVPVVILLAAACVLFAVMLTRTLRDQRATRRVLGGVRDDASVASTARRALAERVPYARFSGVVAARDALVDTVPAPTLVIDAGGVISHASGLATALLPGVAAGVGCRVVSDGFAEIVANVLDEPRTVTCELVIASPTRRVFETYLSSYRTGEGLEVVAILVDVTANVDFRESRRLFSAAVSHELRTPLARILGLAETLGLPQSQEEREALVAQTEIEVDNLRRLIDEMLLLAALDRGELASTNETVDAGAIAEIVIADRSARRSGRDRALTVDITRGLTVPLPAKLLEVVIGNLVDNALRHAGADASVRVAVRLIGDEVEITVADDGVGIAAEHLPHVFERFYRGEASRAGPGTGLGLAVVKHIVEAHRGRVSAESHAGAGTTVRLVVPLVAQPVVSVGSKR